MGWDGMGCDGMGCDGMGCDGMGGEGSAGGLVLMGKILLKKTQTVENVLTKSRAVETSIKCKTGCCPGILAQCWRQ